MKKTIVTFVTAAVLAVPSLSFAAETQFSDITNHPAAPYIQFMQSKGMVKGTGNGQFHPDMKMDLKHLNRLLTRVSGKEANLTMTHRVAVIKGIVDLFGLNSAAEALTAEETNALLSAYKDQQDIPDADRKAVAYLVQQGVLVPAEENNQLRPHQEITRAEAVTLLAKLAQKNLITLNNSPELADKMMDAKQTSMNMKQGMMKEKMAKMMAEHQDKIMQMEKMLSTMNGEQKEKMMQLIKDMKAILAEMKMMMAESGMMGQTGQPLPTGHKM
ncbi:MAG: S-layer homology domain-containing protein [Bacillota bacterium]